MGRDIGEVGIWDCRLREDVEVAAGFFAEGEVCADVDPEGAGAVAGCKPGVGFLAVVLGDAIANVPTEGERASDLDLQTGKDLPIYTEARLIEHFRGSFGDIGEICSAFDIGDVPTVGGEATAKSKIYHVVGFGLIKEIIVYTYFPIYSGFCLNFIQVITTRVFTPPDSSLKDGEKPVVK